MDEAKIEEINRQLKAAIPAKGGRFVDAYAPFRQACGHDAACPLFRDSYHPSLQGYERLGRLLAARP
jgi:hypothetical protein